MMEDRLEHIYMSFLHIHLNQKVQSMIELTFILCYYNRWYQLIYIYRLLENLSVLVKYKVLHIKTEHIKKFVNLSEDHKKIQDTFFLANTYCLQQGFNIYGSMCSKYINPLTAR